MKTHSLDDLVKYHKEAQRFFAAELAIMKEAIPLVSDQRLGRAAILLMSAGQTGTALLGLAGEVQVFTGEVAMLARAFMEKVTNFCYLGVCDNEEFRAFELHPAYKYYHNASMARLEDSLSSDPIRAYKLGQERQEKLKTKPIVQEALKVFSETKHYLNWTKKTLDMKIDAITASGKMLDIFFTMCKYHYYSDASEALHGSLYGSTFNIGVFDPELDRNDPQALDRKLHKDVTCTLLHLGMLIHESLNLISTSSEIEDQLEHSSNNRLSALNLLFEVLGVEQKK